MKETFKDIPGHEKVYQVSDLARVKSLKYGKERILKCHLNKKDYLQVILYNGKRTTFQVHQLVAITFLKHKPNGHKIVVDHIDNIKTNNYPSNLRLITQRMNSNRKHLKSSSKFIGVCLNKNSKKYEARIRINKKRKHLGSFNNELDASNAYQSALSKLI